jgi:hypothetical protein
LCRPQTGRTHQIRLACQLLNHPIANDLNYSGDIWYGNPIGAEQSRKARAELETIHHGRTTTTTTTEQRPCAPYRSITDEPATRKEIENMARQVRHEYESFHDFLARTCLWCARLGNSIHKKNQLEFLVRSRGYGQTFVTVFCGLDTYFVCILCSQQRLYLSITCCRIWLHALQYDLLQSDKVIQSYRTQIPSWC